MSKPRGISIYSGLLTLAISGILPFFLLVGWFAYTDYQRSRDAAYSELLNLSRALMSTVDSEIAAHEAILQAVARLPSLREGDLATFYDRAQRVLELLPKGSIVVLADANGQQLINTAVPFGEPLPVRGDMVAVRKVFETGKLWLSDLYIGSVTKIPVVALSIPIFDKNQVIYELVLSLPISDLHDSLMAQRLPLEMIVIILDRQSNVIARSKDNAAWVGKPAAAQLRKDMTASREGLSGGRTLEGIEVLSAFTTSSLTEWKVAIARPAASIAEPLRRRTLLLTGLIAAVLSLVLALTLMIARTIGSQIAMLQQSAKQLSKGEPVGEVNSSIREISSMSGALSAASVELREREAALKQSEDAKASIIQCALDCIVTIGEDGKIVEFNPAAEATFGWKKAEVVGKSLGTLIVPPEHRQAHSAGMKRYLATGKTHIIGKRIEMEAIRADGSRFPVELAIAEARGDGKRFFTGYMRDISDRKRAADELKAATDQAIAAGAERAALLGQLAEGVIATDAAGRIVFVNDAAARLHGVARIDVEPDEYSETYHLYTEDGQPYPPHELPLARAVLKRETVVDARWRILRPDGTDVLAIGTAQPVTAPDGTHVGAVLTMRDDTQREAAERQPKDMNITLEQRVAERTSALVETNERLKAEIAAHDQAQDQIRQMQKIEAVGQLTGGIAHDFNNMLAVIIGSLRLLQKRLERGETNVQRFIDGAVEGAERAAALTARLLAFSRRQTLMPQPLDSNRLVTGMSEFLRRTIPENIQIETVLAGGLWRICADASQLENGILNLAVNARDAMPDGGKLTIETANCWLDDIYAASHRDVTAGQYVMIAVTDNGSGMTPEVSMRAFDPFFTTKPTGQGTGLGLSQVYGFIKQSGGHLKIYSEIGQGTTIKVYLPRYTGTDEAPAERSDPRETPHAAAQEKILLVEDEANVRNLTSEMLRDLGYRVIEADSGAKALALLEKHDDIDLLFTDIVMPGMNGRVLADTASKTRPGLRVLFTTGYTRNAIVHNGVLDADLSVIMKPYTFEALANKLSEVLLSPRRQ